MQYALIDQFRTIKIFTIMSFCSCNKKNKTNQTRKTDENQLKSNGIHIVHVNYESVLELKRLRQVFT